VIAALTGLVSGVLERQRLRSRVHVLEGLLEIKSELIDRQREELKTLHASTRGSELVLEHVRLCLRELRVAAQPNQIAVLNELEGVLLETLLAA
jgi:hypothetical protein